MDLHNSYVEVDLGEISRNIGKIRRRIGPDIGIIAVLKGNAYGSGTVEVGKYLADNCGIEILGLAGAAEAVPLREAGIDKELLLLGGIPYNVIPAVVEYDLQTPAFNTEYLELLEAEAKKRNKTVYVHIKIETGLNRIGVKPGQDLDELCLFLKNLKHVCVCGIFTHFIQSGNPDKTLTLEQMGKFKEALSQVRSHGFSPQYVHVSNSGASTWLSDEEITHIRPGGLLYGYDDNLGENWQSKNLFDLKETLSWHSYVTNVKTVPPGETVGYDCAFKVTKPTDVATVSMGYGDGYPRTLGTSGKAEMLVCGKRAPVIAICMDQLFLDVTGIPVRINDQVTIVGKDGNEFISVFELARKMNQTYLAAASLISGRVGRVYKE